MPGIARRARYTLVRAVMETVAAGTPYVGLHVASPPFKSQLDYRQRLGRWPDAPEPDELLNQTQLAISR